MAKEKEARRPFNLKREVKLLPGYIILLLWVIFTIALLGWVFGASFSTTAEIFQGKALKFESGLHFENYAKAWNGAGVAGFFGNSLIYSVISCTILILVCAPELMYCPDLILLQTNLSRPASYLPWVFRQSWLFFPFSALFPVWES